MASRKVEPPPPRRRRDPETARAEILDAAERVLAAHPPDAVGLKEVAAEAGVSHGLVSHYFGTYADLVIEVLLRRRRRLREKAVSMLSGHGGGFDTEALLAVVFAELDDPVYLRLSLWAQASGRAEEERAALKREQGGRHFADAAAAHLAAVRPDLDPAALRARLDVAIVVAKSAAYGFMTARPAWMGSIGKQPSAAFDKELRKALAAMVRRYLLEP